MSILVSFLCARPRMPLGKIGVETAVAMKAMRILPVQPMVLVGGCMMMQWGGGRDRLGGRLPLVKMLALSGSLGPWSRVTVGVILPGTKTVEVMKALPFVSVQHMVSVRGRMTTQGAGGRAHRK